MGAARFSFSFTFFYFSSHFFLLEPPFMPGLKAGIFGHFSQEQLIDNSFFTATETL